MSYLHLRMGITIQRNFGAGRREQCCGETKMPVQFALKHANQKGGAFLGGDRISEWLVVKKVTKVSLYTIWSWFLFFFSLISFQDWFNITVSEPFFVSLF